MLELKPIIKNYRLWIFLADLIIIGLAVIFVIHLIGQPAKPADGNQILPDTSRVIKQLPKHSAQHPNITLADSNQPVPTNSWLTPLALDTNSPVYSYPWQVKADKTGLSLSLGKIISQSNTVIAANPKDLSLNFGSDDYKLAGYDDLSATLAYQKSARDIAKVKLVQGSPYVFVTLGPHQSAELNFNGKLTKRDSGGYLINAGERHYGLWLNGGSVKSSGRAIDISAGQSELHLTLIAIPNNLDQDLVFGLAGNTVTGTAVTHKVVADKVTTSFSLQTANNQPTLFGELPHQYQKTTSSDLSVGDLPTILGSERFFKGNDFSYDLPAKVPDGSLITTDLSNQQRNQLNNQLKADIGQTKFDAKDSYGAGKQLYRAANLLELARELNQPAAVDQISTKLRTQLDEWLDPHGCYERNYKCFYYDPDIGGIVGKQTSFGSEQFNDHNFHYGYFIYAAAVLGRYDEGFLANHKLMVDALIRDIMSPKNTKYFPKLRSYDAYAGHSWADGWGDSASGNNQESSSEAVNAWYAVYLWGKTTGNQDLQYFATWLYQNEVNAALTYWLDIDTSQPQFAHYKHQIVSLVWQGKLDYGTFFSNKPSAKLGIQLIPMSPGQAYLAKDKNRIMKNLAGIKNRDQLQDYLLMYRAFAKPKQAAKQLNQIKPSDIDSADSKSYLEAWLFNHD